MKRLLALTGLLLWSLSANAALIDNGTYLADIDSGLDWKKLTETDGLSYNYVSGQLGDSGLFSGWQYATANQFETMVLNQGGVAMSCGSSYAFCGWSVDNNGVASSLITQFGDLGGKHSQGLLAEQEDFFTQRYAHLYDKDSHTLSSLADDISTYAGYQGKGAGSALTGSFLVRTSEVPLPGGALLFASALFSLSLRKLKSR